MSGRRAGLSLLLGLWMTLLALLCALLLCAGSARLFAQGLSQSGVFEQGWFYGSTPQAFAQETIDYLTGARTDWSPKLWLQDGQPLVISDAFFAHMEEVRDLYGLGRGLLCGGCVIAAGLWFLRLRRSLWRKGYWLGAAMVLTALFGLCLWAAVDFNGFWSALHYALLPGGVFSADELIVWVFLPAFSAYLLPFCAAAGALCALILALPLLKRGKK